MTYLPLKLQLKWYKIVWAHRVHPYHTSKDTHSAWMKEGGATHKHHQHSTLVHGGFLRIHHIVYHYPCALHKYMFHIIERFPQKHTSMLLRGKEPYHCDSSGYFGNKNTKMDSRGFRKSRSLMMIFVWKIEMHFISRLLNICQVSIYCQRWWNRRVAGKPLEDAVNFQFLNSHHTRTCGSVTHAIHKTRVKLISPTGLSSGRRPGDLRLLVDWCV